MRLKSHYEQYEYLYDSEEERNKHSKEMKEKGFKDSGQSMFDINYSFENPDWKWYGKYFSFLNN